MLTSLQSLAVFYPGFQTDVYKVADGHELRITFIKHASLLFEIDGKNIFLDPVSAYADYAVFPKADLIIITHEHHDHLDPIVIEKLKKENTVVVANINSFKILGEGYILTNGEHLLYSSIVDIYAVPAYNTTEAHKIYHPIGRDNGYILTLGGSRVYISVDT